ncbi:prenyltransferase/squalene oxidase repeat-containing protein [Crossiella sp. CA-258035]|uniref:prenyltransferase/squalene oxidase repeat-containing protein n=1 Tax=Crossiella sp. CA-258035 TaxID=2981138 RepID=UPI0024BBF7E3|nr:prenyltransferase/squalene oxidase repeat-containing protein [Crossiella sp. CA-258035]WHT19179.1 prenyltransferase/squalene oxidase repeat-containing protein [Crossiella sp. CA-258035]
MTPAEVSATARWILAIQRADGAIPWDDGGKLDPWNHVEAAMGLDSAGHHAEAAAALRWLAERQRPDGSFATAYQDGLVTDPHGDSNFTAYLAVGLRHHLRHTGNLALAKELWPVVRAAMSFVLDLQRPDGAIGWHRRPDGSACDLALRAGCASIHHALHSAALLGQRLGEPTADLRAAADRLREALLDATLFLPKPHSMDWYYPVLGGAVTGASARAWLITDWHRFVVPGLGVRCVHDQPWTTGGETAELALTLAVRGESALARALLRDLDRLRCPDGGYWTGYQFANRVLWPDERTTWTAGAVLLAAAALAGDRATLGTFTPVPADKEALCASS